jgi:phosphatidylserine decarboxylase
MTDAFWAVVQRALPHRLVCRLIYKVSRSERQWLKSRLIDWFARRYSVDMSDAAETNVDAYTTFNEFFARALKPDARPIDTDPASIVSPVDGRLTEFGQLRNGHLLQAKGCEYRLAELLAEPPDALAAFVNGTYATIYLAPHNYHRIHAPREGRLSKTKYVPGTRYTVNRWTVTRIDRLFCRNERAICTFDGPGGRMVVVMVGALNVSSISTPALGEIPSGRAHEWHAAKPESYAKGEEIGRFNLGSTVIVVFEKRAVRLRKDLASGMPLRVGETIGHLERQEHAATRPGNPDAGGERSLEPSG